MAVFDLTPDQSTLAYVAGLWTENELCRRVSAERTHLLMKEVFDTFNCGIPNQTVTVMTSHYSESSRREAHSLLGVYAVLLQGRNLLLL